MRPASALGRGRDIKRLLRAATLITLFLLWYAGNITFNIYNKQLLRSFAHPVAVSTLYMGVGGLLGWLSWRVGAVAQPAFTRAQLVACIPLAVCHALTNTLMLTSLNAVAVSLSHTIRARARALRRDGARDAGTRARRAIAGGAAPIGTRRGWWAARARVVRLRKPRKGGTAARAACVR